jgi:hypothetical protein
MHRKCCKRECCPRQKKTRQLRDPCYGYICLLSTWSPRWVQAIYIGWVKHLLKDAIPRCEMPKGSLEGSTCICLLQMKSLLVGKGILMNSGHTSSHEDFKLPTTCAPAGTFYRKYLHFASSFTARRTATLSSANMSLSTHGRFQPRSKQRKSNWPRSWRHRGQGISWH